MPWDIPPRHISVHFGTIWQPLKKHLKRYLGDIWLNLGAFWDKMATFKEASEKKDFHSTGGINLLYIVCRHWVHTLGIQLSQSPFPFPDLLAVYLFSCICVHLCVFVYLCIHVFVYFCVLVNIYCIHFGILCICVLCQHFELYYPNNLSPPSRLAWCVFVYF